MAAFFGECSRYLRLLAGTSMVLNSVLLELLRCSGRSCGATRSWRKDSLWRVGSSGSPGPKIAGRGAAVRARVAICSARGEALGPADRG